MIKNRVKLHNRFDIEIFDTLTGKTEYAKAENIVLDRAYSYIVAGSLLFKAIGVGTGTGTLSPTRTSMFSYLLSVNATLVELVYDTPTTGHVTKKVVFSETQANGVWTEVGVFYSAGSGYLGTHAFITDSEGNTITVNKTNTKIITIYATIYAELLSPSAGNHIIYSGSYNLLLRDLLDEKDYNFLFFLSALKTVSGEPSLLFAHSNLHNISRTNDSANKRCTTALARFVTTAGNSPVRGIILSEGAGQTFYSTRSGYGGTSLPITGIFEKQDYTNVAVGTGDGVETDFNLPVAYPMSSSEKIYVGGVEKTRGVDYAMNYGKGSVLPLLDVTFLNTCYGSFYGETGVFLEEVVVLPQPTGYETEIASIYIKNGPVNYSCSRYDIYLSLDNINWVLAGTTSSGTWSYATEVTFDTFTPDKYKYMKCKMYIGTGDLDCIQRMIINGTSSPHITFTTPPANGAAITADFSIDYINKTSNFVLDLQAELQFGEGA
ncbi:MAG TPA: hypothetical protein DIT32_03435 [Peptococcaceae bacterium]|nr:hypothetical protein [Peptococcaceae bacterium]